MEDNKSMTVKKTVKSGITFGSALAMVISYTTWKSVGWAIFHGLLSWVYVIYFFLRYSPLPGNQTDFLQKYNTSPPLFLIFCRFSAASAQTI